MQLVAYGAQDIYLTGNPQITFFKVVYRRHTNFSMETIEQTLNGATSGTASGNVTCTISRNGDLVYRSYVEVKTDSADDTFSGSDYIAECELEIGGQRVDRHYAEWNQVWEELSTPESKAIGLKAMKRDIGTTTTGVINTMIPLNFWFCRNPGLALPLIALQYHEVKLKIKWGDRVAGAPTVWCDYIYLDTDERRRFAQVSHEYLIEQLQREEKTLSGVSAQSLKLNFNHPVKELIWSYGSDVNLDNVKLVLNGHDRFAQQPDEYFSLKQPFDYHTAVPRQNLPSAAQLTGNMLLESSTAIGGTDTTAGATPAGLGSGLTATVLATGPNDGNTVVPQIITGGVHFSDYTNEDMSLAGVIDQTAYAAAVADGSGCIVGASDQGMIETLAKLVGRVVKLSGSNLFGAVGGELVVTVLGAVTGTGSTTGAKLETDMTMIFFDKQVLNISASGTTDTTIGDINTLDPSSAVVSEARTSKMTRKIGVYSFGLKPEEHQPSGTCNFSRIDNAQLNVDPRESVQSSDRALTIYAVNYNVLRIMSGMGGLAYSN